MPTRWVRVRDTTTGHQFDVDERSIRHGMERLNDPRYPDLEGPLALPRPSKAFVGKDGKPAVPGAVVVHIGADGEETAIAEPAPQGPSLEVVEIQPALTDSAPPPKGRKATPSAPAQPVNEKE